MSIIDIHTHAFPDEIAARAMKGLQENSHLQAPGDGTVAGLINSMDEADIDLSIVCTIATKPGQAKGILKWCQKIRCDRLDPFPSVHPDDDKPGQWIDKIAKENFAGIKLHPMYQNCPADDPRMDPIYAAAAANGLAVASHCGLDIAYPPDDGRASPQRFARVLERFADLKLICTHMGGWRSWDLVEQFILGTSAYLETSFSLEELGPTRAVEMIRRHGASRVLFGSDWPWNNQRDSVKLLRKLGLGEKELDGILFANAAKLLGM